MIVMPPIKTGPLMLPAQPDLESRLVDALSRPAAYVKDPTERVETHETHISWVFVTERFAYKVKKAIRTDFLDYSTFARRKQCCEDELRLNSRYAADLYLAIVPITFTGSEIQIEGEGDVCEYAVKMRRFASDALLAQRLTDGNVTRREILRLAQRLAEFHLAAQPASNTTAFGHPTAVLQDALDNLDALQDKQWLPATEVATLNSLRAWTDEYFEAHEPVFRSRREDGYIRECHGDLHCGNIVYCDGEYTLFDGIEFSEHYRHIDVLSDVAFLAMDLSVRGQRPLSNLLVSTYLERTGDYAALGLLRWYLAFRALVRAKVATIVMQQHPPQSDAFAAAQRERSGLISLAFEFTQVETPSLAITYGLSGSGKSTGAQAVVAHEAAIRIRSDVERKRMGGRAAEYRPDETEMRELYSSDATDRTYARLCELARQILNAGYSVVVDATFLTQLQRARFAELAEELHVPFRILEFKAAFTTLSNRLQKRTAQGNDASDAGPQLLAQQAQLQQPLTPSERALAQSVRPVVDGQHD